MREAWIGATLVAVLALIAAPLSAQQRARPAGAHVVACSGIFAKDSDHLKLTTAFGSKNITFFDVEANDGSKVPGFGIVSQRSQESARSMVVQSNHP